MSWCGGQSCKTYFDVEGRFEEVHVGASNFCVMDIGGEVGYQERAQLVEGHVSVLEAENM